MGRGSRSVRTRVSTARFNGNDVEVTTTNHAKACDDWVEAHGRTADFGLLGLDLEWKPNFTRNTDHKAALLQLSTRSECLVVQLLHLDAHPYELYEMLEDPDISLGGVEIHGDTKKLLRDHGIRCQGEVELYSLATEVLGDNSLKMGLKNLAQLVLGWNMPKSRKLTLSDWSVRDLSEQQVHYAAQDAWASHAILKELTLR